MVIHEQRRLGHKYSWVVNKPQGFAMFTIDGRCTNMCAEKRNDIWWLYDGVTKEPGGYFGGQNLSDCTDKVLIYIGTGDLLLTIIGFGPPRV